METCCPRSRALTARTWARPQYIATEACQAWVCMNCHHFLIVLATGQFSTTPCLSQVYRFPIMNYYQARSITPVTFTSQTWQLTSTHLSVRNSKRGVSLPWPPVQNGTGTRSQSVRDDSTTAQPNIHIFRGRSWNIGSTSICTILSYRLFFVVSAECWTTECTTEASVTVGHQGVTSNNLFMTTLVSSLVQLRLNYVQSAPVSKLRYGIHLKTFWKIIVRLELG